MSEHPTENPQPQPAPAVPWPRWTRALLFVSLALNLLIAGMAAGAYLRGGLPHPPKARQVEPLRSLGFGPFEKAMTPVQRRALAKAINARAGDLKATRAQFRQQMATLLETLRTSPFDAATARKIIEAQQRELFERQKIGLRILLNRLENMTDAERAAFADRLERSLRRPPRDARRDPPRDAVRKK